MVNLLNDIKRIKNIRHLGKNGKNIQVPNNLSLILSVLFCVVYGLCFSLTTYLPATLDNQISASNFTISQSLAYAIKSAFIILMTFILLLGIFIIWYCGYSLVWLRIFIFICIYAFIITLLWVTTFYSKTDHYILAGIIFSLSSIFICLTSFVIIQSHGYFNLPIHGKILCILLPILSLIGLCGLFVSLTILNTIKEIFPSFELFSSVIFVLSFGSVGII